MDPLQFQIIAGFLLALLLIGWLGHVLIMRGLRIIFSTLIGIALIAGAVFHLGAQSAQGWDSLGYFAAMLFLAAPVLLSLSAGGLIAWTRKRDLS